LVKTTLPTCKSIYFGGCIEILAKYAARKLFAYLGLAVRCLLRIYTQDKGTNLMFELLAFIFGLNYCLNYFFALELDLGLAEMAHENKK
jgi:hypothetical protein